MNIKMNDSRIKNVKDYLKKGITIQQLDKKAYEMSDNEYAEKIQKAKFKLFKSIRLSEKYINL